MPTHKDLKRLVRGRMKKTGESYTAARARLLEKKQSTTAAAPTAPAAPVANAPAVTIDAQLAGQSDAVMAKRTGKTWAQWVGVLDREGAHAWPHAQIARFVHETYGVPGWWTQAVAVGYERLKGLRAVGQRRGGAFEANKSKTFDVAVARLYAGFADARKRARWLPGVKLVVRTATRDKSMRISWPDGTSVAAWFVAKGAKKAQVAIQHTKLPDREAATRLKDFWAERLTALATVLGRSS
jgi:hypothetical protein